jgi:hypothetical protein
MSYRFGRTGGSDLEQHFEIYARRRIKVALSITSYEEKEELTPRRLDSWFATRIRNFWTICKKRD